MLAEVADPRHRRGVRHRLAVILGLAVCAVLAGARSFTAIAEWAADADQDTLRTLGVNGAVPSESTFRRVLQRLDADAFDGLAGAWAARRTAPGPAARRVIAVDGKTLRGSGHGEHGSRHLLAAFDHACGVVLGQVEVGAKTNEIPMFTTLLDRVDITDAVITRTHATSDALPISSAATRATSSAASSVISSTRASSAPSNRCQRLPAGASRDTKSESRAHDNNAGP